MRMRALGIALLGFLGTALAAEPPLLYVPFDGSCVPAVHAAAPSRGDGAGWPQLTFGPGVRGQAALLDADCRLPAAGHFDTRRGTIAFWLRPLWDGTDPASHVLFCIYGREDLPEPWLHSRWSIVAQGGRLRAWVWGEGDGGRIELEADITAWRAGEWHHLALTWDGISSGQADAVVRLTVDGEPASGKTGVALTAGPVSTVLDIGRDSDAS
ncbi:MAG: LamG domain-containing protein, partial [Lentisphaeria bacterium]|nr:LamG domain-containing protein [Lentisphaeria bacterium]